MEAELTAPIDASSSPAESAGLEGQTIFVGAADVLRRVREFIHANFVPDSDFGEIAGVKDKKIIFQPGAQKVALFFNTYPHYVIDKTELGEGHVEYVITTELRDRTTHKPRFEGVGSCTTMESKYRYRMGERICPDCGAATIMKWKDNKGKPEKWGCWRKKGGCGAGFHLNDTRITEQEVGKVPNEDIYDQRNTALKMAKKRSFVDASLGIAGITDEFTQDLEDWDIDHDDATTGAGKAPEPAKTSQAAQEARRSEPAGQVAQPAERAQTAAQRPGVAPAAGAADAEAAVAADPTPKKTIFKTLMVAFNENADDVTAALAEQTKRLIGRSVGRARELEDDEARKVLRAIKTGDFPLPEKRK